MPRSGPPRSRRRPRFSATPATTGGRERYQSARRLLEAALHEAAARGEIRSSPSPQTLAVLLLGVMDGIQLQWLLDPDAVDMRSTVRSFIDLLAPPS